MTAENQNSPEKKTTWPQKLRERLGGVPGRGNLEKENKSDFALDHAPKGTYLMEWGPDSDHQSSFKVEVRSITRDKGVLPVAHANVDEVRIFVPDKNVHREYEEYYYLPPTLSDDPKKPGDCILVHSDLHWTSPEEPQPITSYFPATKYHDTVGLPDGTLLTVTHQDKNDPAYPATMYAQNATSKILDERWTSTVTNIIETVSGVGNADHRSVEN